MAKDCAVIAIDPATTSGIAYVSFQYGKLECLTRRFKINTGNPVESVVDMRSQLTDLHRLGLMKGFCPVRRYTIEDQYAGLNPKTAKLLTRVASWWEHEILISMAVEPEIMMPSAWQKFFGVNSRVKREIRKKLVYLSMESFFGRAFASNDVSDALGIAIACIAREVGEDMIYGLLREHITKAKVELGLVPGG